jgi:hypothetical protein
MKRMRNDPELLQEYDFSKGIRGKYARRYAEGTNVVVIDADVAEYFPDHQAVNDSLRSLIAIIRRQGKARPAGGRGRVAVRRGVVTLARRGRQNPPETCDVKRKT